MYLLHRQDHAQGPGSYHFPVSAKTLALATSQRLFNLSDAFKILPDDNLCLAIDFNMCLFQFLVEF